MPFKTITEDGVSRVKANVVLSNGDTLYVEVPIFHDLTDDAAHEEAIRFCINTEMTQYDDEGNALPLEVTIVSITETE
jgi:protein involved in temperature-dependent protein secretion